MRRCAGIFILGTLVFGAATAASAGPYDLQLAKLGNPAADGKGFTPAADGNFQALARELGAGITAAVLEPPTSLGHLGFAVNAELSVVSFAASSSTFRMPTEQSFPGTWLMPSVHVRKGLPFSLEAGARAAWLDQSGMAAGTLEAKWALTEGAPYLPAVAFRGYFTKLFNTPDFSLQTGGVDLSVGKRFAVGGMVTFTPYLGYALGWASATSNVVDFDRERSAADSERSVDTALDNTAQLRAVRGGDNPYNRFYGGARFIGGILQQLGLELSLSSPGSFPEPLAGGGVSESAFRNLPSIFAFNSTVGLDF